MFAIDVNILKSAWGRWRFKLTSKHVFTLGLECFGHKTALKVALNGLSNSSLNVCYSLTTGDVMYEWSMFNVIDVNQYLIKLLRVMNVLGIHVWGNQSLILHCSRLQNLFFLSRICTHFVIGSENLEKIYRMLCTVFVFKLWVFSL